MEDNLVYITFLIFFIAVSTVTIEFKLGRILDLLKEIRNNTDAKNREHQSGRF